MKREPEVSNTVPTIPSDARTDAELLAAVRSGDERAFAAIVQQHHRAVERIVIRMLDHGDEANDVVQEAFIRLHQNLDTFRGEAAIGTYVNRIAINLALNALRRRRWQLKRFVRRDVIGRGAVDEPTVVQDEEAVSADRRIKLEAALHRLPDQQRAVVVLRILEGFSTKETAEMLKVPAGTVMSRLTRALQKLQTDLRAHGLESAYELD